MSDSWRSVLIYISSALMPKTRFFSKLCIPSAIVLILCSGLQIMGGLNKFNSNCLTYC